MTEENIETTEDGFKIVPNEETGEYKIQVGNKEYTQEEFDKEFKNLRDKGKNLEAGFTKKMQELSAKYDDYEALENLMAEKPELETEIQEIIKKHKEGKTSGVSKESKDADNELARKVAELEARIQEEAEKKEQETIIQRYSTFIDKTMDEAGLTDTEDRVMVKNAAWNIDIMTKNLEEKELKESILKRCSRFEKKSGDTKPPPTKVPGKGGGGGFKPPEGKTPKKGSPEWNRLKEQARAEFLKGGNS